MADLNEVSDEFMSFVFKGLDHGVESISDGGGPLVPFVIIKQDEQHKLTRFVSDSYEVGVNNAKDFLSKISDECLMALIAFDGFITISGQKYDAIMVQAYDASLDEGFIFAQRYLPKNSTSKFETIGNAAFIGKEPNVLNGHGVQDASISASLNDFSSVNTISNKPWWKLW